MLGTTSFPNIGFASCNSDYVINQKLTINSEFNRTNSKIEDRSIPSWISKKVFKVAIKTVIDLVI